MTSQYILVNPDNCLTVFGADAHKLYFANNFSAPKVLRLDDSEKFFVFRFVGNEWRMVAGQSTRAKAQKYAEPSDVIVWRKGCGQSTHVSGTNGGTMPCGAKLTISGKTAPYYCVDCEL